MDLRQRADRARDWLLTQAWPLWADAGFDRQRGGFHESLHHADLTCAAEFRRLRVLTRQIYVFARAAELGFAPAEEIVARGVARLHQVRGADGLYPWRFDLDHRPIDETRDLYDHAFVLLALSAAAPIVTSAGVRAAAIDLIARLCTAFTHPQGGFVEALPPNLPRRQNPHMHLLEAALAAYAAFGATQAAELAIALGDLFLARFFLTGPGVLAEFYDEALAPLSPIVVEPGHHYEWTWLLDNLAPLSPAGASLRQSSTRLYDFAREWGVCRRRRVVRDQVDQTGAVLADTARLWPQTERLKAELRRGTAEMIFESDDVLHRYLTAGRPGLWAERMDANGHFSHEPAPASSLYHITCALMELIAEAAEAG